MRAPFAGRVSDMEEALAPGRIDLGLGRAPGTDQATAAALRGVSPYLTVENFPEHLVVPSGVVLLDAPAVAAVLAFFWRSYTELAAPRRAARSSTAPQPGGRGSGRHPAAVRRRSRPI